MRLGVRQSHSDSPTYPMRGSLSHTAVAQKHVRAPRAWLR